MCRYVNVGMCTKSVYQCPLHEVAWGFEDVAAKSHHCVAPTERRLSPAPERALLSSEQYSGFYHLGCLWSPDTQSFISSALLAHWAFLSWAAAGPAAFWHWAQWEVGAWKASGCCRMQLPLIRRSRAVCFEFSFSWQYCYLPNPLTLLCSSECFMQLTEIPN